MNCDQYEAYQLGRLDEETFLNHLSICPVCAALKKQDEELLSAARQLKIKVDTESLWLKVESRLLQEVEQERRNRKMNQLSKRFLNMKSLALAATLMIALILVYVLVMMPSENSSTGLLSQRALEKVEQTERAYVAAIDEMEKKTGAKLAVMDIELALLYRDQLKAIDEQIRHCRDTLQTNPANNQVRRYLLAAFQDKKQTLREIISFKTDQT
jgi:uncharacterized membrane protein YvbJ